MLILEKKKKKIKIMFWKMQKVVHNERYSDWLNSLESNLKIERHIVEIRRSTLGFADKQVYSISFHFREYLF